MGNHTPLFYRVLPPKHPSADRWATLVVMHGRGSNEEDLLGLHPYLPEDWAMVSLRAPEVMGPGQYQWYRIKTLGDPDVASLDTSLDMVEAFVQDLAREIPGVDPNRWVLGGFSQGGLMTAALLERPLTLSPIGSVILSGYLPDAVVLQRTLTGYPIFWGHGTQDAVLLPSWAQTGVNRLQSLGADVTFHLYQGLGHGVHDQELDDLRGWLSSRQGDE